MRETACTVEVASGRLKGRHLNGAQAFLGVPYAKPPVGSRRFEPPQPLDPWVGEREAVAVPPRAPQHENFFGLAEEVRPLYEMPPGASSEDCLYLNVWAPSATSQEKRAVMVWLHGGSFIAGAGWTPETDGADLARDENVVVVSLNHRLGALGFVHLPGAENLGLLDIQAALRWVHENIERFGGDPGRVTLFGQSGGGAKIAALLATPAGRGLFHRAVIQSGPASRFMAVEEAERTVARLIEALGLDVGRPRDLVQVPVGALLEAQRKVSSMLASKPLPERRQFGFNPVVDGAILQCHPIDASPVGVPILIGCTEHEMAPVCHRPAWRDPHLTDIELFALTASTFGWSPRTSLAQFYRDQNPTCSSWALLVAAASAACVRNDLWRMADQFAAAGAQVYAYVFRRRTPVLNGELGAPHCLDVPYVFKRTRDAAMSAFETSAHLSDAIASAWAGFARSGIPTLNVTGGWPRYDLASRRMASLDETIQIECDPFRAERSAWRDTEIA
jgi:para-nitrobenzyl esterase